MTPDPDFPGSAVIGHEYMAALESASVKQDIGPFAAFIGDLVRDGLQGKPAPAVPVPRTRL